MTERSQESGRRQSMYCLVCGCNLRHEFKLICVRTCCVLYCIVQPCRGAFDLRSTSLFYESNFFSEYTARISLLQCYATQDRKCTYVVQGDVKRQRVLKSTCCHSCQKEASKLSSENGNLIGRNIYSVYTWIQSEKKSPNYAKTLNQIPSSYILV